MNLCLGLETGLGDHRSHFTRWIAQGRRGPLTIYGSLNPDERMGQFFITLGGDLNLNGS